MLPTETFRALDYHSGDGLAGGGPWPGPKRKGDKAARVLSGLALPRPLLATDESKWLAEPGNRHLRLRYLVDTLTGGNQRRFARHVGVGEASISPLVNNKMPLTDKKAAELLAALPGVGAEWLLRGVGEPFTDAQVPVFGPIKPRFKPKAKPIFDVRNLDIQSMQALPMWDPNLPTTGGGPNAQELLGSLLQRFQLLADCGCGLSAAQVQQTLGVLKYVL